MDNSLLCCFVCDFRKIEKTSSYDYPDLKIKSMYYKGFNNHL